VRKIKNIHIIPQFQKGFLGTLKSADAGFLSFSSAPAFAGIFIFRGIRFAGVSAVVCDLTVVGQASPLLLTPFPDVLIVAVLFIIAASLLLMASVLPLELAIASTPAAQAIFLLFRSNDVPIVSALLTLLLPMFLLLCWAHASS
jgi:hypothetical protein